MTSNAYITSASGESSEQTNHAISVICYFNIGQDINFNITWTLDPGPWTPPICYPRPSTKYHTQFLSSESQVY